VREPPPHVDDADVLTEVRRAWDDAVERVVYHPVGFGAHHWVAFVGARARLFVTYDDSDPGELADVAAAYAGATALRDSGLEFVLAPLPAAAGGATVAFAGGALSCTPWRDGTSDEPLDLPWTTEVLRRLHGTAPPADIRKISTSEKSKWSSAFTLSVLSPNEHSTPWLRRDATATTSSAGKLRSARMLSISCPTLPVAPTTATL